MWRQQKQRRPHQKKRQQSKDDRTSTVVISGEANNSKDITIGKDAGRLKTSNTVGAVGKTETIGEAETLAITCRPAKTKMLATVGTPARKSAAAGMPTFRMLPMTGMPGAGMWHSGGQKDDFRPLTYTLGALGGRGMGAGTNMWNSAPQLWIASCPSGHTDSHILDTLIWVEGAWGSSDIRSMLCIRPIC